MSNRDSLGVGDLLPQDVIHVFAQEKNSKKGRKKQTRSLGRAFSWFKRKKRKSNGQNHSLGPALDLAVGGYKGGPKSRHKSVRQTHQHGNSHAVQKLDDDDKTPAPPQFLENVFIENSRSKYMEDLHTEALEGLKMMQQEENSNEVEYQDNESTVSTVTVQTDGESGGFMTDSTIPDTSSVVSRQSSMSARSSRSGLTRQASTFRPLTSGKKSEKNKTRRHHRKIPRHVQKELGLDRVGGMLSQRLDEETFNRDTDNSPVTDGPGQESESPKEHGFSPQASNIIHPLSKERVAQLNAAHAADRDNIALVHRLTTHSDDKLRRRSSAASWRTTSSLQQKFPSLVMTMSPQAAYMSKIIPNAVLPPSIDVVELSRNRSRSSLRTVSRSSLMLSSPAPSRASSRASSSRTMSSNITSASRYNGPNLSDNSCWSSSESSGTLVSDSSTISSSSTPRHKMSQNVDNSSTDQANSNSSNSTFNSKVLIKAEQKDGQVLHSLSVIKPKKAPPPPSRSYSLHSKIKRRSRDLAEVEIKPSVQSMEKENKKPGSSPVPSTCVDSPGYHGDTSSLDESTGSTSFTFKKSQLSKVEDLKKNTATNCKEALEEKQEQLQKSKLTSLLSPSSGYSSQDGTSPQDRPSTSPGNKGFFTKFQKLFSGHNSSSLAPTLLTQTEGSEKTNSTCESKHTTVSVNPSIHTLRELFNIPPPPKVHAPPPPPPEVWAHSKRTFELLFGPPAPDNISAIIRKNPKDRRQKRLSPSVSREGSVKSLVAESKQRKTAVTVDHINVMPEAKKVEESGILNAEIHSEKIERLCQNGDLKGNSKEEKVRVCDSLNGMLVKAVEGHEERLTIMMEAKGQKTSSQQIEGITNSGTLTTISLVKMSSLSSPPLVDGPVQPTGIHTTKASTSVVSPASSWPPPPTPMAQVSVSGMDGLDFPPAPFFGEQGLISPVQVPPNVPGSGVNLSPEAMFSRQYVKGQPGEPQRMAHITIIPPPPTYTAPLPPTTEIAKSSVSPKESSVSASIVKVVHLLPVVKASTAAPKDLTPLQTEVHQSTEQAAPLSIPPPPLPKQLQLSEKEGDPPLQHIPPKHETTNLPNSILITHQSINPPTPMEPLHKPSTTDSGNDEPSFLPPTEFRNTTLMNEAKQPAHSPPVTIPLPPPLPVVVPASSNKNCSPLSIESKHKATACGSDVPTEQTNAITPSLLKMVKLRSVENSSETSEGQEQGVHEEPSSTITSSLLQMVKLRSVNNSSEPTEVAKNVKGEAIPSFLQEVKLRSINNSPEPAKAFKDGSAESISNANTSPLQTVKLQAINNSLEPTKASKDVIEESVSSAIPSSLQVGKLQSLNNPEPLEAQEQPNPEAPVNQLFVDKEQPTSSISSEAPQKPIRKSLIMMSSATPPATPPATITSQPTLPQDQSVVVQLTSLPKVVSPTKKSPTTTSSGSMNLQEAIRLRTAARSKGVPASHLSPLSPLDYLKSPTSTASMIFSKSNKKVAVETKQKQEEKENVQNNVDDSTRTNVMSEGESKVAGKVPPPVAKKPIAKGKEAETSDAVEPTAGQEAQQDGLKVNIEEITGTAGTVQNRTPSA